MKKLFTLAFAAVLAFSALTFTGCKKYDDGPMFSLRSANGRIERVWKVSKAMQGTNDMTALLQAANYKVEFTKTEAKMSYSFLGTSDTQTATWAWGSGKKTIILTESSSGVTTSTTWNITRLTSKELHANYTEVDNGVSTVSSFEFTAE